MTYRPPFTYYDAMSASQERVMKEHRDRVRNIADITDYMRDVDAMYTDDLKAFVAQLLGKDREDVKKVKALIMAFAGEQDVAYGGQAATEWDDNHTDDAFEIYMMLKHAGTGRDAYSIMHDAWTLSRMKTMRVGLGKVGPFNEGGYAPVPVHVQKPASLSPENYALYNTTKGRELVKIHYGALGDMDAHTTVQGRRLGMFIRYDNLTDAEKAKDKVPADTFRKIFSSDGHQEGITALLNMLHLAPSHVEMALRLTDPVLSGGAGKSRKKPTSGARGPTVVDLRASLVKLVNKQRKPDLLKSIEHAKALKHAKQSKR